MGICNNIQLAKPTKVLFVFSFFAQFISTMYSAYENTFPLLFEFLYPIAYLWLVGWWLKEDSRRTGVRWPIDLGMFLYVAWVFIVPYHLLKTRGLKGFIGIFSFVAILFAGWVAAAIVVLFLWS